MTGSHPLALEISWEPRVTVYIFIIAFNLDRVQNYTIKQIKKNLSSKINIFNLFPVRYVRGGDRRNPLITPPQPRLHEDVVAENGMSEMEKAY